MANLHIKLQLFGEDLLMGTLSAPRYLMYSRYRGIYSTPTRAFPFKYPPLSFLVHEHMSRVFCVQSLLKYAVLRSQPSAILIGESPCST